MNNAKYKFYKREEIGNTKRKKKKKRRKFIRNFLKCILYGDINSII